MCALEERAARDFGIADATDLVVRLQTAGFGLRDLTGIPGIEANRYFLVCIRSHEENEKLIQTLRASSSSARIKHARTSFNQRPKPKGASLAQGAPLSCASLNLRV